MTNPNDPRTKDQNQKSLQDAARLNAPKSATPGEPQKGPGAAPIQIGQNKPADQRGEAHDRDMNAPRSNDRTPTPSNQPADRNVAGQHAGRDQGDASSRSSQSSDQGSNQSGGKPAVSDPSRKASGSTDSTRDDDMGGQKSGDRSSTPGNQSAVRDLANQHPSRDQGDTSSSRSSQSSSQNGGKPVVSDPSRKTSGVSDTQRDDSSAEGENTESDRLARGTSRDTPEETKRGGTSGGTNRNDGTNRPSIDKSGSSEKSSRS